MRLMLIRHGKAGEREEFAKTGKPDAKRPLTSGGKKKMKQAARGLCDLYPRIDDGIGHAHTSASWPKRPPPRKVATVAMAGANGWG